MTTAFLSIARLARRLAIGTTEALDFETGVCLLVGRPNTGKTKWLQTLDFLLGDSGANPYESVEETGLAEKYESASVTLRIGENRFEVERRWREPGGKGKLFVDGQTMLPKDFQHWLLEQLGIPVLHYPKGNPMSGQTWPELSFRSLLRHIYRQQRFWSSLVDQQSDSEFLASLLQFLGLAEYIFTDDYGELVTLKLEVERLRARRDQYGQTLGELARDLLADDDITVDVNVATIAAAQVRLMSQTDMLRARRVELLARTGERVIDPGERSRVAELGEQRAAVAIRLENLARKQDALSERAQEIGLYRADLAEELERIARAEDAGPCLRTLRSRIARHATRRSPRGQCPPETVSCAISICRPHRQSKGWARSGSGSSVIGSRVSSRKPTRCSICSPAILLGKSPNAQVPRSASNRSRMN